MERIVFMGTPEFAVASLKVLMEENGHVVGVVTAPDKPSGRGQKISCSEVKQFVQEKMPPSFPVLQPSNLKDPGFTDALRELKPDLFVVVAFRMLPRSVWTLPTQGTINLHASLLPQYRGAAPIQRALMNGESRTGLTTFFINEDIDTGHILLQRECSISPDDTAGTLHDRLMEEGAYLLKETIDQVCAGTLSPRPQENLLKNGEVLKTAPKIEKNDTRIFWNRDASSVHNQIRGLSPYPGAWDILLLENGKEIPVKILLSKPESLSTGLSAGNLIIDENKQILVSTGKAAIQLLEVQPAGKKRIPAGAFLNGYPLSGSRFLHTHTGS